MTAGAFHSVDDNSPGPTGASVDLVSLVVATYGRGSELGPLMDALVAQTDRAFEVIVVDQNRDDRVVPVIEAARAAGLAISHVRQPEANLSLARNGGLQHARGSIVAFPDDDCWYEPDVIARVRERFGADRAIDGVVARWVEAEPQGPRPAHRLSSDAWRQFRGGDATSFTLFFKPERVRALGGFDTRLGTGQWFGSGEETDLVMRMLAAGDRVEHVPDARIHHWFSDVLPLSWANWRRSRSYGRGTGALYAKHRLSAWVMLRGLVAPFLHAVKLPRPLDALALAGAKTLGRLEGCVLWAITHGRTGTRPHTDQETAQNTREQPR